MKKIYLVIIVIVALLIITVIYLFSKGMIFYKPGNLANDMQGKLDPSSQKDVKENYWKVEENIELYYFTQGKGNKPVLIIHGGPGTPATTAWKGLDLADDYRFYYYHQRGCGKSTRPFDKFESSNYYQNMKDLNEKLGLATQIADIERIRKILSQDKLTVIGHSYGGFLAILYAIEFPENVEKIVLVSPANMLKFPVDEDKNSFNAIKNLLDEEKKKEFDEWQDKYFDYKNIFKKNEEGLKKINVGYLDFYIEAMKKKGLIIPEEIERQDLEENIGGWMVHGMYIAPGMKYDYRQKLKNINLPTLVIYGENEFITSGFDEYVELLPNAQKKVIDKASHFTYSEKPEEFKKIIKKFLEE